MTNVRLKKELSMERKLYGEGTRSLTERVREALRRAYGKLYGGGMKRLGPSSYMREDCVLLKESYIFKKTTSERLYLLYREMFRYGQINKVI